MLQDQQAHDNARAMARYVALTASATLTPDQELVDVDTTAGAVTVTLPPAVEAVGRDFTVRFVTKGGSNNVTVAAGSDAWIALANGTSLAAANCFGVYRSNGRFWYCVDVKAS